MRPPDLKPGDELTARWLNDAKNSRELPWHDAASGLESSDAGGLPAIRARPKLEIWAKVTGAPTGAKYPWTQQLDTPSGGWVDGPRSGTASANPLVEVNGNTAITTGKIVRAWKDSRGFCWKFVYGSC